MATKKPRKYNQVIEAALAEFLAFGFEGANMDRISLSANVSKRTVYNYFPSKEALFQEIVELAGQFLPKENPLSFSSQDPISEQLRLLAFHLAKPNAEAEFVQLGRLVMIEKMRNPEMIKGLIANIEKANYIDDFFQDAHLAGCISKDGAQKCKSEFQSYVKGRSFWPAMSSGVPITEEQVQQIAADAADLFKVRFEV
ncbi:MULTISPECIES: TetR/AcrR family transcriptional regulator [unclassified Pseudovibrio]|uniref:TetR/AcrR family transcriptional regulator n=1 Tax=unclassified Pseudovibrio TaxID=2627060 RepID=UPI0007AE4119|nr:MULTISPECIES: TetR/AcrR family transcriptional regulator [unclassified Pseudovibrio]KZK99420.1 Bacterial regulatory protein, tetR family [Pseudovibrio sp. Ad5]KZL02607.1 Bacterial regulatory protein, tetR family [Pseudovibrio sp. W74]KZL07850.1 Bacterial regulatory protein, tetR family [Pseudovibrio sp. Ad14]